MLRVTMNGLGFGDSTHQSRVETTSCGITYLPWLMANFFVFSAMIDQTVIYGCGDSWNCAGYSACVRFSSTARPAPHRRGLLPPYSGFAETIVAAPAFVTAETMTPINRNKLAMVKVEPITALYSSMYINIASSRAK